jgi:hypothetical protein
MSMETGELGGQQPVGYRRRIITQVASRAVRGLFLRASGGGMKAFCGSEREKGTLTSRSLKQIAGRGEEKCSPLQPGTAGTPTSAI